MELYEGLLMLQHRGQDSAGMVTTDWERFAEHKDNGLVRDVFGTQTVMNQLKGVHPPVLTDSVETPGADTGTLQC